MIDWLCRSGPFITICIYCKLLIIQQKPTITDSLWEDWPVDNKWEYYSECDKTKVKHNWQKEKCYRRRSGKRWLIGFTVMLAKRILWAVGCVERVSKEGFEFSYPIKNSTVSCQLHLNSAVEDVELKNKRKRIATLRGTLRRDIDLQIWTNIDYWDNRREYTN